MINPETNENLPLLTILVGIQGSGKSTWAGEQDNFDGVLLSSDALRSEYPNWTNDDVLNDMIKRTFDGTPLLTPCKSLGEQMYQLGWVCPKCGAVMSPNTNTCPFCSNRDTKVMY